MLKVRRDNERFGVHPANFAGAFSLGYRGDEGSVRAQVKRGSGIGFRALQVVPGKSCAED